MKKYSFYILCISLILLWVFSIPVTEHLVVRSLEKKYPQNDSFPESSAIVLLGGAGIPPLPPRVYNETGSSGDRIFHTARLFKKNISNRIIITGGKLPFILDYNGSDAEISANLLVELFGIDSNSIILEEEAMNTHENGKSILTILKKNILPLKITLVTSATHMFRSVKVMEKIGLIVYPAPTDFKANEKFQWNIINFLPNAESLSIVTSIFHEYYGI